MTEEGEDRKNNYNNIQSLVRMPPSVTEKIFISKNKNERNANFVLFHFWSLEFNFAGSADFIGAQAEVVKDLLQQMHVDYLHASSMSVCRLMTDDGSENLGCAKAFMESAQQPSIQHIIAQRDVIFSNSMIEAAYKNLKYHFLYHKIIPDMESLQQYVIQAIDDYNYRPNAVLNGLTPAEVLSGKTTDKLLLSTEMKAGACIQGGSQPTTML